MTVRKKVGVIRRSEQVCDLPSILNPIYRIWKTLAFSSLFLLLYGVRHLFGDVGGIVDNVEYISLAKQRNWTFENIISVSGGQDLKVGFVTCFVKSSKVSSLNGAMRSELKRVYEPGHSIEMKNRPMLGPSDHYLLFNKDGECLAVLAVFPDPVIALMSARVVDAEIGIVQVRPDDPASGLFRSGILFEYLTALAKEEIGNRKNGNP